MIYQVSRFCPQTWFWLTFDTVGQARSTSVKPISDIASWAKYTTFSWAVVRTSA